MTFALVSQFHLLISIVKVLVGSVNQEKVQGPSQ